MKRFEMGKKIYPNGDVIKSAKKFHSYPTIIAKKNRTQLCLGIPTDMARKLGLKANDLVEVAFRKISLDYAEKEYGVRL